MIYNNTRIKIRLPLARHSTNKPYENSQRYSPIISKNVYKPRTVIHFVKNFHSAVYGMMCHILNA